MLTRISTAIVSPWARFGWLLLALLAVAPAALADPPSSGAHPLPGYEIIRVGRGPYNRINCVANIDGVKGLMIVDTGASFTALSLGKYDYLLKNGVKPPVTTTHVNESSAPVAVGVDVQLGAVHLHNVPFPLVPRRALYESMFADMNDRQYDGLIGENILRHYNVILDCARLCLYLNTDPRRKLDLNRAWTQNGWTRVPMSNVGLNFAVPCTLGGHPYRLEVDTGSPFTLLDKASVSKEQIEQRELPMEDHVLGYNPTVDLLVRIDSLQIGDYVAKNVHPVSNVIVKRVLDLVKSRPGDAPLIGLLGGDILAANGAVIDIGNHNLYLKDTGASAPAKP